MAGPPENSSAAEPQQAGTGDRRTIHIGGKDHEVLNVRRAVAQERGSADRAIEEIGQVCASSKLLLMLLALHLGWVLLSLPWWPWNPWDPYPFTFIATVASVEAPFLALLILMYQRRSQRINELRNEINLQIVLHIERELTVALRMMERMRRRIGVELEEGDEDELGEMQEVLDPRHLLEEVRKQLIGTEGNDHTAP